MVSENHKMVREKSGNFVRAHGWTPWANLWLLTLFTDSAVKKIAVCAGSGSSILGGVSADVYLTGEMSHHEVLDANHRGRTVILCDHSNTERGYLSESLRGSLLELFENQIDIIVSERDADPLTIV